MAKKKMKLIRFDWAMKRILRDKANFVVLEGFLSVLLQEQVKIKSILSSQGNKEREDDKYNDVDVLIENEKGEFVIVEVQNTKQHDYFHRILYGASKIIAEYIQEAQAYVNVKKVISITIAYFDLGPGKDYVYHGTTSFKGIHQGDVLSLSFKQRELYKKMNVYEIYPEYWIIKAGLFDETQVKDELDQWIYFFKTGEILEDFTAAGLEEAKDRLNKMKLSEQERREYNAYVERLRKIASQELTAIEDVKDLIKKEVAKEVNKNQIMTIVNFYKNGVAITIIAQSLQITEDYIREILKQEGFLE